MAPDLERRVQARYVTKDAATLVQKGVVDKLHVVRPQAAADRNDLCGRMGLRSLALCLFGSRLLEVTPSIPSASRRSEYVGKRIKEAPQGEEQDRQNTEDGEDAERHGRVQRSQYLPVQVTEPGLLRRAFISSATAKWLEPRSPTLDATPGVSVTEVVNSASYWCLIAYRSRERPHRAFCGPTSIRPSGSRPAPIGTPRIWMRITRGDAKVTSTTCRSSQLHRTHHR